MELEFKITRKQQAFVNAKEDEVLYGGALSQRVIAGEGKRACELPEAEKRSRRGERSQ